LQFVAVFCSVMPCVALCRCVVVCGMLKIVCGMLKIVCGMLKIVCGMLKIVCGMLKMRKDAA